MGKLVSYSRGSHVIEIGDRFWTRMGTKPGRYVVEAMHGLERFKDQDGKVNDPEGEFVSITSYSPTGLGGTPTIGCRNVRTGEIVDFCGDSVARMLAEPEIEPEGWDEDKQREHNQKIYAMK